MDKSQKKTKNLDSIIPTHWVRGADEISKNTSRLSPKERVAMIVKVYEEILCREPDTRDLNFYKYSSATEETIRTELIESDEHKVLINNGREFRKTKNLLENSNSKINSLESKIQDQQESLKQMEILLKEKNLHIEDLKEKIKNPFENK